MHYKNVRCWLFFRDMQNYSIWVELGHWIENPKRFLLQVFSFFHSFLLAALQLAGVLETLKRKRELQDGTGLRWIDVSDDRGIRIL